MLLPAWIATGDAPLPDPSSLPPEVGHFACTWGPWGLLGFVVLAIVTGRLVPRSVYLDMEKQRDFWKAAATEERANATAALRASTQTAVAVTAALPPHPEQLPEPPAPAPGVNLL